MILEFKKRIVQPGIAVLAMKGSIHCGPECARLEDAVNDLIAAGEIRVILDMAGVTHADSAAMGSLVRCLTRLRAAGGALRIAAAQPMIDYSFKLTKLDRILEIFPTVDQAAQGFAGAGANPALHS